MKSSSKIIMLAAATAVVSSAITAYAMKQVLFPAEEAQSFNELFAGSAQAQGQVTRVSQLPAKHIRLHQGCRKHHQRCCLYKELCHSARLFTSAAGRRIFR